MSTTHEEERWYVGGVHGCTPAPNPNPRPHVTLRAALRDLEAQRRLHHCRECGFDTPPTATYSYHATSCPLHEHPSLFDLLVDARPIRRWNEV